jgi:hypothetical protein
MVNGDGDGRMVNGGWLMGSEEKVVPYSLRKINML